jgi:arsenical-resistance protein 2
MASSQPQADDNQNDFSKVKSPVCLPWHAAYPVPRALAGSISRLELLGWFKEGKEIGKAFVLVDLRRTDFEVSRRPLLQSFCISR